MISLLVPVRVADNRSSRLIHLLDTIAQNTRDPSRVEVLLKFDTDDPGVPEVLEHLQFMLYRFTIKHVITARGKGYFDLHVSYNQLLTLISKDSKVIAAVSDDEEVLKDWDQILLDTIGDKLENGVYIVHGRPHPPHQREDYLTNLFHPNFSLDDLENLHIIEEVPFWSRRLLELCGMSWNYMCTDVWTILLEHYLWIDAQVNITLFTPMRGPVICEIPASPLLVRYPDPIKDQIGGERWNTVRKEIYKVINSVGYQTKIREQSETIVRYLEEGHEI